MSGLQPTRTRWDAIVVGTGMGGATFGHALARAGLRVLFCEQGRSLIDAPDALRGLYPELRFERPAVPRAEHAKLLARAGRWSEPVEDRSSSRPVTFVPFLGCGSGGSTSVYGMALERFFPSDFAPRANHPEATGSTLPERWPVSYDELVPYYEAAERLYGVRGTADPNRPGPRPALLQPPPLTRAGQATFDLLAANGLKPYRLPQACRFAPQCEGCQGYLCPHACKNDSARTCLAPAIAEHGAVLLDECRVVRLEASRDRVTGVVCTRQGETLTLRGDIVALAAGALATPRVLLESTSAQWPLGLANASGLVGRNLMRHHVDLYALRGTAAATGNAKEIGCTDFYVHDGHKLGSLQSFGRLPPVSMLLASITQDLRDKGLEWASRALAAGRPLAASVLARAIPQGTVLASVLEDLPYADNRVWLPAPGRLALTYRIREHDARRIAVFRHAIGAALRPRRALRIDQAANNQQLAHACGTARFGEDPAHSVLDRDNRAHGIANLYVVDSSFFPSSGGTNPALTIAANALRVAARVTGVAPAG